MGPSRRRTLLCPRCEAPVGGVTPYTVSYFDPNFAHGCGFKGILRWARPARPLKELVASAAEPKLAQRAPVPGAKGVKAVVSRSSKAAVRAPEPARVVVKRAKPSVTQTNVSAKRTKLTPTTVSAKRTKPTPTTVSAKRTSLPVKGPTLAGNRTTPTPTTISAKRTSLPVKGTAVWVRRGTSAAKHTTVMAKRSTPAVKRTTAAEKRTNPSPRVASPKGQRLAVPAAPAARGPKKAQTAAPSRKPFQPVAAVPAKARRHVA